jgi:polyhydroxyalkanoate synthesis regulator phasin
MAKRSPGTDALRTAVDRTYQATVGQAQVTRERAQELVDELAHSAGRVRQILDDLRLASGEDLRRLQDRIDVLEQRVAALEKKPAAPRRKPPQPKRTSSAKRTSS